MKQILFAILLLFGCSSPFEPQYHCAWATIPLPNDRIRIEGVPGVQKIEARVRVCPTSEGPALQLGPKPRIVVELDIDADKLRLLH